MKYAFFNLTKFVIVYFKMYSFNILHYGPVVNYSLFVFTVKVYIYLTLFVRTISI